MDATNKVKRNTIWIIALVMMISFLVLDAGALAWTSSMINGHQFVAEIFTFIVVLSGAAITVWRMKAS